ncbi:MAG: FtsQ-type POTRA domain-containing protein [Bdellovibrionaceae bacterium]|nr:FtsQ-type POTRA domain-containing protein [Pseudobdellovibrionaceae bacterium]
MKILLRLFVTFIFLPGALAGFLYHLDRKGFFDLDQIHIVLEDSPNRSLHLKPLVDDLDKSLEMYRGQSLWSLEMRDLSKTLGAQPWIADHSLSREWPRSVVVKIRPQEVKALYFSGQKALIPVIEEGKFLAPIEAKLAPDVVVFEGKVFEEENFRKKAVKVLNEIPERGAFSRSTISEVRWNQKDGFSMTMVKSAVEVKVGEDAIALKSARLGQVLEYLNNRGIHAKSLDANLSKKVLVKLEGSTQAF